ncbi:hypothetical protein ES703_112962 [subsurface metagenome]
MALGGRHKTDLRVGSNWEDIYHDGFGPGNQRSTGQFRTAFLDHGVGQRTDIAGGRHPLHRKAHGNLCVAGHGTGAGEGVQQVSQDPESGEIEPT